MEIFQTHINRLNSKMRLFYLNNYLHFRSVKSGFCGSRYKAKCKSKNATFKMYEKVPTAKRLNEKLFFMLLWAHESGDDSREKKGADCYLVRIIRIG
jgi:hypothetical protein